MRFDVTLKRLILGPSLYILVSDFAARYAAHEPIDVVVNLLVFLVVVSQDAFMNLNYLSELFRDYKRRSGQTVHLSFYKNQPTIEDAIT